MKRLARTVATDRRHRPRAMATKGSAVGAALHAIVWTLAPTWSHADEIVDLTNTVRVEAATATPAPAGGHTIVRFKIVNDGPTGIHLIGITTPLARQARLRARVGTAEVVDIGSIGVGPEATLDLTTSHLWYELYPLDRELVEGESFPVRFDFGIGQLSVPVHVHPELQK